VRRIYEASGKSLGGPTKPVGDCVGRRDAWPSPVFAAVAAGVEPAPLAMAYCICACSLLR
jgi:hypothetical protein